MINPMTSQQQVQQQYPEASIKCTSFEGKVRVAIPFEFVTDEYDTPEEAWDEAARNINLNKEEKK